MVLPLNNIRVLDFSNLLPGPFTTMILADLGAEIVKVERPEKGDFTRRNKLMFNSINRNKKSITLDLKKQSAIDWIKGNIERFDVIVEGFRPGVMKKLGLDYEDLSKINDRIIYCSISGYGQSGSLANVPGHDVNYLALSGALSISGDPTGPPEAWGGVQIADLSAAMYAVISIMAALRNRDEIGRGDYIDVSITDSVLAWMAPRIGQYFDKKRPSKEKFMGRGAYGTFETKDRQYVALGSLEDHFFENLCRAIDLPELAEEEKYNSWEKRCHHARELNRLIQDEIRKKTLDEWLVIFLNYDVPSCKVIHIEEIPNVEVFKERKLLEDYGSIGEGEYFIKFPVKFENIALQKNKQAPKLGEHNKKIIDK